MMLAEGINKIPLARVMPYNEDDLLLFLSHKSAIVIKDIKDDVGRQFSIKELMEKNDVFACKNFDKKVSSFRDKFLRARIERYFITKKVEYLFFDEEEQDFIKNIFAKNNLSAFVELQSKDSSGNFKKRVIIDNIKERDFDALFGNELTKLKVPVFVGMSIKMRYAIERKVNRDTGKKNRFSFLDKMREEEQKRIDAIFRKFPDLQVSTKQSFKAAFRMLSKKLHTDITGDDDEKRLAFQKFQDKIAILKKSSWYKRLPEGGK